MTNLLKRIDEAAATVYRAEKAKRDLRLAPLYDEIAVAYAAYRAGYRETDSRHRSGRRVAVLIDRHARSAHRFSLNQSLEVEPGIVGSDGSWEGEVSKQEHAEEVSR